MAFFGNPYPLTGLPDDFGLGYYGIDQHDYFEEFRIASAKSGSRWNWVVGVFLSDQTQYDFAHVIHPNLPDLVLANFGVPISQVLGSDPYLGMWVAFNDVNTERKSLFGNVDFRFPRSCVSPWRVGRRTAPAHRKLHRGSVQRRCAILRSNATGNPFLEGVARTRPTTVRCTTSPPPRDSGSVA
jgi:hypothetical protein